MIGPNSIPEAPVALPNQSIPGSVTPGVPRSEHSLYVKNVPVSAWEKARHNAITSRMSFKAYIIRVLSECQPFLPSDLHPAPPEDARDVDRYA